MGTGVGMPRENIVSMVGKMVCFTVWLASGFSTGGILLDRRQTFNIDITTMAYGTNIYMA